MLKVAGESGGTAGDKSGTPPGAAWGEHFRPLGVPQDAPDKPRRFPEAFPQVQCCADDQQIVFQCCSGEQVAGAAPPGQ